MSRSTRRRVLRLLHIAAGCALGAYLYSPLIDATWAARVLQIGVFPAIALSGLAMWQQARIGRWWARLAGGRLAGGRLAGGRG